MSMKASLLIEARDRASAGFAKIAANARRMGDAFKPVEAKAKSAGRSIGDIGKGAAAKFAAIGAAAVRMALDYHVAERAAYGLGYAIGWTVRKGAGLGLSVAKWGIGTAFQTAKWAAVAAAGSFGYFLGSVIRVGAQFEQFEVTLRTVMGSAAAAKKAMAWVQKFAEATPYELEDVMAAFVKLRTYGIDATDGSLRVLGDTAAAMGKPLDEAVEALADAMTGEFERLKSFGIRASQQGDKVTLSWIKNGKNMSRAVKKDSASIKKALEGIWDSNFKGAGDAQSRTLTGLISNLKDKWTGFLRNVADAGIFDMIKGKLQKVLDWANAAAKDGRMKKWATEISDKLEKAVNWAWNLAVKTDWNKVGADLKTIASAAWDTAKAFADLVGSLKAIADFAGTGSGGMLAMDGPLGGVGWNKGFYYVKPKWASDGDKPSAPAARPSAPTRAAPAPRPTNKQWMDAVARQPKAQAPMKVGGALDINIRTDAGTTARTTKLSSNNRDVPIRVNTGRAMAGAA